MLRFGASLMATLGIASHAQQDVGGRSSVALSLTLMAVGADSPPRRQSVSFRFISIHLPHKRPRCVRDRYAALRLTLPYAVDDWSPNARVSGDLSARFVGMHQVLGPLWRRGRRHSLKVRSASRPHVLAVVALLIAATQCWVSATWRVVHSHYGLGDPTDAAFHDSTAVQQRYRKRCTVDEPRSSSAATRGRSRWCR